MTDRKFLEFVKRNEGIGYGRMMQIISFAWYRMLERKYPGTGFGAFTTTCIAFLNKRDKKLFFAELEQDEEVNGMDY